MADYRFQAKIKPSDEQQKDLYYYINDMAKLLGLDKNSIGKWQEQGKIPPCEKVKIGYLIKRRWPKELIDEFLRTNDVKPRKRKSLF